MCIRYCTTSVPAGCGHAKYLVRLTLSISSCGSVCRVCVHPHANTQQRTAIGWVPVCKVEEHSRNQYSLVKPTLLFPLASVSQVTSATPTTLFRILFLRAPLAMQHELSISDWCLNDTIFAPTPLYTHRFNTFLSLREGDDVSITFIYASAYNCRPTFVHASRMDWVGGPFRAMVERGFAEQRTSRVSLCDDDDPQTFALIRDFLYAKDICLTDMTFPSLLRAARAAHRWQLMPLFVGLLDFVRNNNLLNDLNPLLQAVDLLYLPGVPKTVLLYFWDRVGLFFGHFQDDAQSEDAPLSSHPEHLELGENGSDDESLEDIEEGCAGTSDDDECGGRFEITGNASNAAVKKTRTAASSARIVNKEKTSEARATTPMGSTEIDSVTGCRMVAGGVACEEKSDEMIKTKVSIESEICPKFPDLWPLALSHGMVDVALHNITLNWTQFDGWLLDLVLQYLEPRIEDDDKVCCLIAKLSRDTETLERVLNRKDADKECSTRAIRLLAKTLSGARIGRKEMRCHWKVTLSEDQSFVRDIFFYPECGNTEEYTLVPRRDLAEFAASQLGPRHCGEYNSRKKSRPSKYELLCQSAVRVTLSVGFDDDEKVVLVCWKAGMIYDKCSETLMVLVEVLDDGCKCTNSHETQYEGKGGCVGREVAATRIDREGLLTVRLDSGQVERYRQAHRFDCAVTISLVVKLISA